MLKELTRQAERELGLSRKQRLPTGLQNIDRHVMGHGRELIQKFIQAVARFQIVEK